MELSISSAGPWMSQTNVIGTMRLSVSGRSRSVGSLPQCVETAGASVSCHCTREGPVIRREIPNSLHVRSLALLCSLRPDQQFERCPPFDFSDVGPCERTQLGVRARNISKYADARKHHGELGMSMIVSALRKFFDGVEYCQVWLFVFNSAKMCRCHLFPFIGIQRRDGATDTASTGVDIISPR